MHHFHFETYPATLPLLCLTAQTAVECKIAGGEATSCLSVHAAAVPTGKEILSGEFRYGGKVLFSVICEDAEGQLHRIERGAEFSHAIEDPSLAPSHEGNLRLFVAKTSVRRENGSVYATAIVSAAVEIFAPSELRYLADTDAICRKEEIAASRFVFCSGTIEAEDEFETDYLNDVLSHAEQILVERAECGGGFVTVEGKINLLISALREEGLTSFERLVPFRAELPCAAAAQKVPARVDAALRSAKISANTDEEKGKTSLLAEFTVEFSGGVWERSYFPAVTDAFSESCELTCLREERELSVPVRQIALTERVSGTCACTVALDFSSSVQTIVSAEAKGRAEGGKIEGTIAAKAIVADKDGFRKGAEFTLPFSFDAKEAGEVSLLACGLKISQRREGEAEAEATLKGVVTVSGKERSERIVDCCEGEAYEPNAAAISVYLPCAGDGLWETAKRLRQSPQEVERCNPELTYPLTGKERIVIYRRKEVSF